METSRRLILLLALACPLTISACSGSRRAAPLPASAAAGVASAGQQPAPTAGASPAPPASASPAPTASASPATAPAFPWVPAGQQLPAELVELPPGYLQGGGDPVHVPSRFESDTFTDRSPGAVPPRLRLVAWNVFAGHDALAIQDALTRDPTLAAADFVLLCEVPRHDPRTVPAGIDQARELARLLRMNYVAAPQWDFRLVPGAGGEHVNVILSKYPLGNVTLLRLPPAYDWYGQQGRLGGYLALGADALVGGERVRLYACHLEVRDGGPGRARQGAAIRADAALPDRPARCVVAGDFNTWLAGPLGFAAGLEPVLAGFFGAGWEDGLRGFSGPTHFGVNVYPQRLDWIFHRGLGGAVPGTAIAARGSDHLPITFGFSIP